MHRFFNPGTFMKFANRLLPVTTYLSLLLFAFGLYYALFASPADYQQGQSVRIMYVHVPAAWMALGIYVMIGFTAIAGIIWKNPLSDMMCVAAAPIGTAFALICLITGSLWGKPIWGTWWVWDARLTSMLLLFFFYVGYLALYHAFDDKLHGAKVASVLAIVGLINIPIVKFSVDWWNTLHQSASIIRTGGVAIDASMLIPLLLMFGAFSTFFITLVIYRLQTEINLRKADRITYNLA